MLSLQAALLIKDPALVSRWFITTDGTSGPYECVAETAELSFHKTPAKGRHFQGTQRFYPDFKDIDGITITFYETHTFDVTKWLKRWRAQIVRSDGAFGLPIEYKRKMSAYMYTLEKNIPVVTFEMTGVWPTDKLPFSLTYDDEVGRLQVAAMFSIDQCDIIENL